MIIAIASDRVYPYFKSGAEKRYWDIAQALKEEGHEVHFFTGQWPGMKEHEVYEGINLHGVYKIKNYYKKSKRSITESIIYAAALIPHLWKVNYDILDCDQFPLGHILVARIITLIRKKKMFVVWHEVWGKLYYKYIGIYGFLGTFFEWFIVKISPTIISASDITAHKLISELQINENKIKKIGNFIDIDQIDATPASEIKSDIIFVGRLMPHKNIKTFIDVIFELSRKFPDIKGLIVGTGPEEAALHQYVYSLNITNNVMFINNASKPQQVYALLKSAKILLHPSEREGFGLTIAEANAAGIPAITINHQDNASQYLIKQGVTGYVEPHNSSLLAQRIANLLIDSPTLSKLSKNAKKSAQKYDWKEVKQKLFSVYFG